MKKIFYFFAIWGASTLAVTFRVLSWALVPFIFAWACCDEWRSYWDGIVMRGLRKAK